MPIFSRKRQQEVQGFICKLVNNHSSELEAIREGPRQESRVRLSVSVLVVPVENGKPAYDRVFAAVTREFSTGGLSIVVESPRVPEDVILGFQCEGDMRFALAEARHLNSMGAGFYQLGLQLIRMLAPDEHPGLESLSF